MGDFFISLLIGGCILVFFVTKVVAAVDGDGEIKKTWSDGFAECFEEAVQVVRRRGVPTPALL